MHDASISKVISKKLFIKRIFYLYYFVPLWRQDSSLAAWLTQSPWYRVLIPLRYISFVHTYAATQTVQIRGIIMQTERITDSRRIKKRTKKKEIKMTNMSKLTCKRSIKSYQWLSSYSTLLFLFSEFLKSSVTIELSSSDQENVRWNL